MVVRVRHATDAGNARRVRTPVRTSDFQANVYTHGCSSNEVEFDYAGLLSEPSS
jgi:hypothetical protein